MKSAEEVFLTFEQKIRSGELKAGDRLPSVRELALQIGVDKNTVSAAYGKLKAAGLTVQHGRGGTTVRALPVFARPPSLSIPSDALDLTHGNPNPSLLPDLSDLRRVLVDEFIDAPAKLYGGMSADAEFLHWAANQFSNDDIPCRDLVVTPGALDAIDRLLAQNLNAGDKVGVEEPTYPPVLGLLSAHQLIPVPIQVDQYGLSPSGLNAALRDGVKAVVMSTRAQNPTGASLDADRAKELRAIAAKSKSRILWIDDDHFSLLSQKPYHFWFREQARWAVIRSVSKFLGPDNRIAVCSGDSDTMRALSQSVTSSQRWVSHLLQRLSARLLADPAVNRKIRQASATYKTRTNAFVKGLAKLGFETQFVEGLNVWIPTPQDDLLAVWLLGKGIAVRRGLEFSAAEPVHGLRITTSLMDQDTMEQVLQALKEWKSIGW